MSICECDVCGSLVSCTVAGACGDCILWSLHVENERR